MPAVDGAAVGMGWAMAPTRELRGHAFGNVVMSRFPMVSHAQCDLTWRSCEHRCAQRHEGEEHDRDSGFGVRDSNHCPFKALTQPAPLAAMARLYDSAA